MRMFEVYASSYPDPWKVAVGVELDDGQRFLVRGGRHSNPELAKVDPGGLAVEGITVCYLAAEPAPPVGLRVKPIYAALVRAGIAWHPILLTVGDQSPEEVTRKLRAAGIVDAGARATEFERAKQMWLGAVPSLNVRCVGGGFQYDEPPQTDLTARLGRAAP